ncbi:MAG TPA: choice-of-anchor Q domain-containing protein, partial [bacterium]|nr:choice-of-anchor Q domain-containing protein [bacterium]
NLVLNDGQGGGIANKGQSSAVYNTTVVGNRAEGAGGGIWTDGPMTLSHVTVANNSADANEGGLVGGDGGGISNEGSVALHNSIVAGNVDESAGHEAPDCFSGSGHVFAASGANIVQDPSGCAITGATAGVLNVDPLFDPAGLSDNGEAPKTLGLQAGSPAIDAAAPSSTPVDQRSFGRPADGDGNGISVSDLGAFEVAAVPFATHEMVCGNGLLEWPEQCDDDNTGGGDGCNPTCLLEVSGIPVSGLKPKLKLPENVSSVPPDLSRAVGAGRCGDKIIQAARGEECDDGGRCLFNEPCTRNSDCGGRGACLPVSGDGCSVACRVEPKPVALEPWYKKIIFWK